jgi:hypothetical protein
MVRPTYGAMPMPSWEDIQLTPWDLYCLSIKYIQKGILLPRPPAGGEANLVDALASSLSRALGRYYHFSGRLAVDEHGDGTVTIPLRPTGEGAELVHAVAPGVAVADIVGSVVQEFLPLNGVCNADAAIDSSLPVLCAQVTELDDGLFIGMSMNHTVGDGAGFWDFLNAWSAIHRGDEEHMRAPAPVHRRWFVDTSPVPIPVPFSTLQHAVRRLEAPPVRLAHGFFTFSAASVKKLKARANDEMLKARETATISSLQALVAHLWRAVSRARGLPPGQATSCSLLTGCRGAGAHARHPGWLRGKRHHAQHDTGLHRRRDPRQGAGLDGLAAEPCRGVVRRGKGAGMAGSLGPGALLLFPGIFVPQPVCTADHELAAVRHVR